MIIFSPNTMNSNVQFSQAYTITSKMDNANHMNIAASVGERIPRQASKLEALRSNPNKKLYFLSLNMQLC